MQITLNLEESLWKAAQRRAECAHTSVDVVLGELVRQGLQSQPSAQAQSRFTFSVPGGLVTSENVRLALEEDDE